MALTIRTATLADLEPCARICFEAFCDIAGQHGFPPDIPNQDVAEWMMGMLLQHPGFYKVVAERDGKVVGSNFMDERSPIYGIGPITIDPAAQDAGAGRMLMEAALRRADEHGAPGVRLVQSAYHPRSLALYAKLGFDVREPLVNLQGPPPARELPGAAVRPAVPEDLSACDALCTRVHGHHRSGELEGAIRAGAARVVVRDGRITGYTTGVGFTGHSVGECNLDLQHLIAAAEEFTGPGFLLPSRNGELFRWCLDQGLRVVQTLTLMSRGLYSEPRGAFLPSVLY